MHNTFHYTMDNAMYNVKHNALHNVIHNALHNYKTVNALNAIQQDLTKQYFYK